MKSPKQIRTLPEILLIALMVLILSLLLYRAANITFAVSAIIFIIRLIPKIIVRSVTVCKLAIAVALSSQNKSTLGFNVFIKNPEANTFDISLFVKMI